MPVPASEPAEGLQTPEVFSQNELYGRYDEGKMVEMLDSFLAGTPGVDSPRGSNMGVNTSLKFDPELTSHCNLDAKESSSSSTFNVDDLFNTELQLFGEELPFSSQEMMNNFCRNTNFEDISDDCGQIGMSVEEQNESVGYNNNNAYSQFIVAPVNKAQGAATEAAPSTAFVDTKPDIVQSALRQAEMDSKDNFTPDELANATFVVVQGDNGDAGLGQFMTLDPSAIYHIADNDTVIINDSHPTDDFDTNAATIPSTVHQAAEPGASTSGADNVSSTVVIKSCASSTGDFDTTKPDKSRGGRKRRAPSSVADSEDWVGDEGPVDYKEKRRRNNLAVRKSRALAKEKNKTTEEENDRLREENEKKSREIEILQREVQIYKELFERSGFNLPRK